MSSVNRYLIIMFILQGCLQKGDDNHQVASAISYEYYLDLYADNFTRATVGTERKTSVVTLCDSSPTRAEGGCSPQLYSDSLPTEITEISFAGGQPPQTIADISLPPNKKIGNHLTASVKFTFDHAGKAHNCTIDEMIFGTVKNFDLTENCTDKPSIYMAFMYYQRQDVVGGFVCGLSSAGINKLIHIHTANVIYRHGYISLPHEVGDNFTLECNGSKLFNDQQVPEGILCFQRRTDSNGCNLVFQKKEKLDALDNEKVKYEATASDKATDDTKLEDIRVISYFHNAGIDCELACKADTPDGAPIGIRINSLNIINYFSVDNFCRDEDDALKDLSSDAYIKCDEHKNKLTLTADIVATKKLCISKWEVTANDSCPEKYTIGEILFREKLQN